MCEACNEVITEAVGRKKKNSSDSTFTKELMKLGGAALGYGAGYSLGANIPKAPGAATIGGALLGGGAGYISGGKLYDYLKR